MLETYLDTKRATIAVLRDLRTQQWIAEHSKEQISYIDRQLIAIPTGMGEVRSSAPYSGNSETARAKKLDKKTLVVRKYEKACEFIQEFEPGWVQLSRQEQDLLTFRFIDHEEKDGIQKIMHTYCVSKSEAYRMSNNALEKLAKLLFG